MSKRLLIVSDLHVGSNYAIRPLHVDIERNQATYKMPIGASTTQKIFYKRWEQMCDDIGRIDAVIVNGDLCDGLNPKGKGKGIWTSDIRQQVNGAVSLLEMIKTRSYYVTQGSYYHTGENISTDELVAMCLGGTFGTELFITVEGVRLHAMHAVGTTRSGIRGRTAGIMSEVDGAINGENYFGNIDVLLRGHTHYYCQVSTEGKTGVITPCWKGRDEFAATRTLHFRPNHGYVTCDVKGTEYYMDAGLFNLDSNTLISSHKI